MTTTIRQQNERFLQQERKEIALSMTPAQIAEEIRQTLKTEFPSWKFSVRTSTFAGGFHVQVYLLKGPRDVFAVDTITTSTGAWAINGHMEINQYHPEFMDEYLTPEGVWLMKHVIRITNRRNWDESDYKTDYFDVHYYTTVSIGRWDRHYTIK